MSELPGITSKQRKEMAQWISTRPKSIQKLAKRLNPFGLFLLKETKQVVYLFSYNENGTVSVVVSRDYNPDTLFERTVFGIKPSSLKSFEQKGGEEDGD